MRTCAVASLALFACGHVAAAPPLPLQAPAPPAGEVARVLELSPNATPDAVQSRVLRASLAVGSTLAAIDAERDALQRAIDSIQAGHDARATILNVTAAVLAAGSAMGTGLTLSSKTDTPGIWITTLASGVGALLSATAALSTTVGRPAVRIDQPMLAPILGDAAPAAYAPVVWRWLQAGARSRLLARWKGLDPETARRLCEPLGPEERVDLDELRLRRRMLDELRVEVELFQRALLALQPPGRG